ncbi:hypothetical protein O9993_10335 [Vibrio lentus]|nr:hypothetical protein [Vibrio lentus]
MGRVTNDKIHIALEREPKIPLYFSNLSIEILQLINMCVKPERRYKVKRIIANPTSRRSKGLMLPSSMAWQYTPSLVGVQVESNPYS